MPENHTLTNLFNRRGALSGVGVAKLGRQIYPRTEGLKTHDKRKEIPLKEWMFDRASELGIDPHALRMRIVRGQYPKPTIRREGRNRQYVQLTSE